MLPRQHCTSNHEPRLCRGPCVLWTGELYTPSGYLSIYPMLLVPLSCGVGRVKSYHHGARNASRVVSTLLRPRGVTVHMPQVDPLLAVLPHRGKKHGHSRAQVLFDPPRSLSGKGCVNAAVSGGIPVGITAEIRECPSFRTP